MPPPAPIRVLPIADRVEEELLSRARSGGVALGADLLTIGELLRRLLAAAELEPLPDLAARLIAGQVAPTAARGTSFETVAGEPGFAPAFLAARATLRAGGLGPAELASLAGRTAGLTRQRLTGLARIAQAYEAELARRGLTDEPLALSLLPERIARGRVPLALRGGSIAVEDVLDFSPARSSILAALAAAGTSVTVRLPALASRPGLAAAMEPTHRALALDAPGVGIEEKPVGGGALTRFHARLFDPTLPASGAGVSLIEAGDEPAELRAAARTVREKLASGVPADDIVVAARGMARRRERLGAALSAAGIPWRDRRGTPALEAPPAALLLAIVASAERHHPREALARILTSRYVEIPGAAQDPYLPGRRIAELLRDAASRDDRGDGHPARLAAHARRLAASARDPAGAGRADAAARAAERLESLLGALRLPRLASIAGHAGALTEAMRELGVERRLRALEDGGPDAVDALASAALARDARAFEVALGALDALREAAARADASAPVSLGAFHGLLTSALGSASVRTRGARGGAVRLCDATELPGRTFEHLVLIGLWDGGFPARGTPEPLLDADDREAINAAAGRPVLRGARTEEVVLFALSCLSASTSLTCIRPCHDAEGRELLPSPFFDEARAAAGVEPTSEPAAPIPPLRLAAAPAEARARAARLLAGAVPEPGEQSLLAGIRNTIEPRMDAAHDAALAAFPAPGRAPAPGRLLQPGSLEAVATWLSRRADRVGPSVAWLTSVSALEDYASCPFRFLGKRILDLGEPAPAEDDLDAREGGTLLHEMAAAVYAALGRAGLLPLAGGARAAQEQEVVRAACESALAAYEKKNRTGPDPLWAVRSEAAIDSLLRLVEIETRENAGAVPLALEAVFGDEGEPPLLLPAPDGPRTIAVRGRVDRVDRVAGGLLVIDYKSGPVEGRLDGDEQGRTSFQLPIYAMWARQRWGGPPVDALYRSFKNGATSRGLAHFGEQQLDLPRLLELDPAKRQSERGEATVEPAAGARGLPVADPNLADAAWAFYASMREGRFPVAPTPDACRICSLATVCRVDRHGVEP